MILNSSSNRAFFQGPQLCVFKVETVHFDIDIHTIGINCPALKELHIVNARVKASTQANIYFLF